VLAEEGAKVDQAVAKAIASKQQIMHLNVAEAV